VNRKRGRPVKELLDYPLYEENESIQYWLGGLSPRSQKNYLSDLPFFVEWLEEKDSGDYAGITPDKMIDMRMEDLIKKDHRERDRFEKLAMEYYQAIKPEMAPWTSAARLKTVMSFFKRNRYPLAFRRGDLRISRRKKDLKVVPVPSEVKQMYEASSGGRNKAILLFMAQCGLTPIDVSMRNAEEFTNVAAKPIEELTKEAPVYFSITRHKTDQLQETCLSIDLIHELKIMLRSRKTGPLFIGRTGRRLAERFISDVIRNLQRKAGVREFKPKNLRDAYKDALDQTPGIPEDVKKLMMGHAASTSGLYGSLNSAKRVRIIREAYIKAYKYLSVEGPAERNSKPIDPKVQESINRELEGYQTQLAAAMQRNVQFDEQIRNMQENIKKLHELMGFMGYGLAARHMQLEKTENGKKWLAEFSEKMERTKKLSDLPPLYVPDEIKKIQAEEEKARRKRKD